MLLKEREITDNGNGYPQPQREDKFVYGFETFADAEKYAAENGGEVAEAKWKDGWRNCNLRGVTTEPLKIESDWYGDNFNLLDADWAECYPELNTAENRRYIKKYVDFDKQRALFEGEEFIEAVDNESMQFTHDTTHIVVGVHIEK